jgi:predicted DNA binding CopG/RHH family protein
MVTRMPREVGDAVRSRAAASGLTLSDYIASLLAADVSRPSGTSPPRLNEELPMTG